MAMWLESEVRRVRLREMEDGALLGGGRSGQRQKMEVEGEGSEQLSYFDLISERFCVKRKGRSNHDQFW